MVKKLFKHEFLAWLRIMAVVYGVMVSLSVAFRLFLCIDSDAVAYQVLTALGTGIYVMFLGICLSFCSIFGVVRFYKHLFTGEGYLTLTLPVPAAAHIWVKALTSAAILLLTLLMVVVSALIVMAGDVLTEVIKAATYLLQQLPSDSVGHIWGFAVEILLILVASSVFGPMLYYACICIGQLFRKHRILGAIGVYFGYYYVSQILISIVIAAFTILGGAAAEDSAAVMGETADVLGVYHGLFCTSLMWTVGFGLIYYVICHHIISKKLNLE